MAKQASIRDGIETFLDANKDSSPYLIPKWSRDLESQYLVHAGNVEVEEGSQAWTGDGQTWANHRWPYQAGSTPNYKDKPLKFSPAEHLARIGTTWWNWVSKRSVAVAFDIDMEGDGHATTTNTVTETQLAGVVERLKKLEYVTIVRSTGGKGVHVYVFFANDGQPAAENHNEHTQVALATLQKMSADANYDFGQHMDVKGVILWIWSDTSGPDHKGFTLIQHQDQFLTDKDLAEYRCTLLASPNRTVKHKGFNDDGQPVESEGDAGGYKVFELEDDHKSILKELESLDYDFIWQKEFNMAHTNTRALSELFKKRAEDGSPLKGLFETTSSGHVQKPNCYITPRPGGVFQVKRFGNGIAEHATWNQKDNDTWCFYNEGAPISSTLKRFGKFDGSKYLFQPEELKSALEALGHTVGELLSGVQSAIEVRRKKDGTFHARFKAPGNFDGWNHSDGWQNRTLSLVEDDEVHQTTLLEDIDNIARFLVTPQLEPYGWALKTSLGWISHKGYDCIAPKISVLFGKEAGFVRSLMIENPWVMDAQPFGPIYPSPKESAPNVKRLWNHGAPQIAIVPSEVPGPHPHWDMIYDHLGQSLDAVASTKAWCQKWGITSGADYLRFWLAAMIQDPFQPLPYLFFYGPQNSGKSMFHESVDMLLSPGSVESASGPLTNQQGFNYEIANSVIGFIEEKDLSSVKGGAYSRMKEWVTARKLTITKKGETPYSQRNFLKMVQMANSPTHCSMEDGDTRIVALAVMILKNLIPRAVMEKKLRKEAPFFLRTLLTIHLPESHDRLRVPMLANQDKTDLESMNQTQWEDFASENLIPCDGASVKFSEFHQKYKSFCVTNNIPFEKSKSLLQLLRNRGDKYVVGSGKGKQTYIANFTLNKDEIPNAAAKMILTESGRLVKCTE